MQQHRVWVAGTFVWLFTLFNIERIHEPINLASFVYVLATVCGVCMLTVRRLRQVPLAWTMAAALLAFLVTKCALGYSISLDALPLTLLETVAVAGTLFLARRIGVNSDAFAEATARLLETIRGRGVPSLSNVESNMQREIRRARRYERPLTMVTIRPEEESLEAAQSWLVEQLQRDYLDRYARGRLADLLLSETKANDLLAWDGKQFVLMLPETGRTQAQQMLRRVADRIGSVLKLRVATGLADFPDNELTYSGLLEAANPAARSGASPDPARRRAAAVHAAL